MPSTRHAAPFVVATIFIDAVGFGIILPVLPALLGRVGHTDLSGTIALGAWMGLAMAIASFFASPVMGNLGDRYGRRRVLLIALAALSVDYVVMATTTSLAMLFVARTLSGAFGGSFGAAQAALADISTPDTRAKNFGLVGAAFGIGFVAGPALGGLLGSMGPHVPFYAAAVLGAANFLYGLTLFPETLAVENRRAFDWRRANPLGAWRAARAMPGVPGLIVVLVLWQIASLVYPLTWSFYGIAKFGWGPTTIGLSLAAVGIVIATAQTSLVGPLVKRLGERDAASLGLVVAVLGFIGFALATQGWMAFVLLGLNALQSLVQPSLNAMMSRRATASTQGEVQGIGAMAMGMGSIVAPLLLTRTMAAFTGPAARVQFPGAGFAVAALFGTAALVMLRRLPRAS
jgi:DHA1 family tetracycline resistance protein-like MFS transporter